MIPAPRPLSAAVRGLLFIGDPHLWSFKPGRRRDASFQKTVLGKIAQAVKISNERRLWPIFLGDLFHAPDDNDTAMLVQLARVLQQFQFKPVSLEGNHDKNDLALGEDNPLTLLGETGQIEIIGKSGAWARLVLEHEDGRRHDVLVGGSPYGHPLPTSFEEAFGQGRPPGVDTALWLTHEDLAFEGSYPGALPIQPIPGLDIVVNGHMHATKTPVLAEATAYYNPGNITRMSIDLAEHVPAVWEWTPFDNPGMPSATGQRVPALIQHVLEHAPATEAFDFQGHHTRQATLVKATDVDQGSLFVRIMQSEEGNRRTDDATYARESLVAVLDEREAPAEVRHICEHLCDEALVQHREKA